MNQEKRALLAELAQGERVLYRSLHPSSESLVTSSQNLLASVPMTWMSKWPGGFPLGFTRAKGSHVVDLDGHELVDFALGDTGAMAGHSPPALARALAARLDEPGGVTTMLTHADAQWVGEELARRFGLEKWSFTLSATDANRWMLRLARLVTRRDKVLVFSYSYHGTVDETFVVLDESGRARSRPGNVAPAVDPTTTTRVVEFNDLNALRDALAHGDVAAVLTEPALTNVGIVLPEEGFLEAVRELCDETGTLLILDETHTFSAGPGGATRRFSLRPDAITIGKSLGGGVPCGAFGLSEALAARVLARGAEVDLADVGGVGGTLAGNALSLTAMRAVLSEVLTEDAFGQMERRCTELRVGVERAIAEFQLNWSVTQLGARCEYRFTSPAPKSGTASQRASDPLLEEYLHLFLLNRGVILTPFHNMVLMSPDTSSADVALHDVVFREALENWRGRV